MRKPDFCICENKDADQLRSDCAADQRLCFRYIDTTIPLVPKSEISSLLPSSVVAQPGLCGTWSEPKDGFSHNEAQLTYAYPVLLMRKTESIAIVLDKDNNDCILFDSKSNRKTMNKNWSNQKANPSLETKTGNKNITIRQNTIRTNC